MTVSFSSAADFLPLVKIVEIVIEVTAQPCLKARRVPQTHGHNLLRSQLCPDKLRNLIASANKHSANYKPLKFKVFYLFSLWQDSGSSKLSALILHMRA